jgi:acetyl-CoA carboxylase carboxyltransferase component
MENSLKEKMEEIARLKEKIRQGGGPKATERQHSQGKMTARERIERLLDPGSLELGMLMTARKTGFEIDERELPADAVVTAFGTVEGRSVAVFAQDFTVLGGSIGGVHARKVIKTMERAIGMQVPIIGMIDSAGIRIQDAVTLPKRESWATLFYLQSIASGVIPQISLMMGPCAAGAAYSPLLTDFVFMVRGTSHMYLASPTLIRAATSVETTEEEIGGATMHGAVSGCCDVIGEDDKDCLDKARKLLSYLPQNNREPPPRIDTGDPWDRREEELLEVVPDAAKRPYDMKKILASVVDKGSLFEIKSEYAKNMITAFARLDGHTVGIVANQPLVLGGAIDINASDKHARFVRFCDAFGIPLVFFADNPAYLPGVPQEQGGILRHGAKIIYALSESTVPKITIVVRKAFGGGQVAMCNEPMGADLVLGWPSAEIGLMSSEGAVDILYRKEIASAKKPEDMRREKIRKYQQTIGKEPFHSAAMGFVEEIIDPRETRPWLVEGLRIFSKKREALRPGRKHGNMPL